MHMYHSDHLKQYTLGVVSPRKKNFLRNFSLGRTVTISSR